MTKETTLKIPAIHCSSCAGTVERHIRVLPGVDAADVDADSKEVHLRFDESRVSLDRIREALDEIGFYAED